MFSPLILFYRQYPLCYIFYCNHIDQALLLYFPFKSIVMLITLKELANFMMDFVNKTFVPLLRTGMGEHEKCLQHWKSLSEILHDIEKMSYWNLQSCLKQMVGGNKDSEAKEARQYKKADNNRSGSLSYKTYDNFFQKKQQLIPALQVEDPSKTHPTFKSNNKDHSELKNKHFKYASIDANEKLSYQNQKEQTLLDPEGFEKLIQSFRKVYQNFENNHKKLLRENQNYKQNFKQEVSHF